MNRQTILSAIAIVLLAIYGGAVLLLLLLVVPVVWYFTSKRQRETKPESDSMVRQRTFESTEEVVKAYGEPTKVVVLDASKANELSALILFYLSLDKAIICGCEIRLSDIISVAPKNLATPYTIDEYAVILTTNDVACPTITLRVGYDAGLAREIAGQISCMLPSASETQGSI